MNRILLAGAALIALSGCALTGQTPPVITPASVANDISIVDQSLQRQLADLKGVTLPAGVQTALADLDQAAKGLAAQETLSAQKPQIQRIEDDINAVVSAAAGSTLPANIQTWLEDAQLVLVPIETALNIIVPADAAKARLMMSGR